MIEILPYQEGWPEEFRSLAYELRRALGGLALRIDHIGSTSVPGLDAKDIIDVQVTVTDLSEPLLQALKSAGLEPKPGILADHIPPGTVALASEWEKRLFVLPPGQRRANIHVRVAGRSNQRYALLFRDYLRAHPLAAEGYAEFKRRLAHLAGDDTKTYSETKDPVCDILMSAAEDWAALTGWVPGPSDA